MLSKSDVSDHCGKVRQPESIAVARSVRPVRPVRPFWASRICMCTRAPAHTCDFNTRLDRLDRSDGASVCKPSGPSDLAVPTRKGRTGRTWLVWTPPAVSAVKALARGSGCGRGAHKHLRGCVLSCAARHHLRPRERCDGARGRGSSSQSRSASSQCMASAISARHSWSDGKTRT